MKKFILLLSLHFVFANAFSQNMLFQENFEKGILNEAWKITSGKWYVANLEEKGIRPPSGDNNFALASAGDAEIMIDMPVENQDPDAPIQLSFTYWVHSKGSKGLATIEFISVEQDILSTINFEPLPQKEKWGMFNQEFKAPKGTSVIRLKLGERSGGTGNTVYFKSMRITRKR